MEKRMFLLWVFVTAGFVFMTLVAPSRATAQEKQKVQYKVIKTGELLKMVNPSSTERILVRTLTAADGAKSLNGIFAALLPAKPGEKPAYHYHKQRDSVIMVISGEATEMVEGKAIPLKAGDIIFIPPNIKHTILNASTSQEMKYIEFFAPTEPDAVQVKD